MIPVLAKSRFWTFQVGSRSRHLRLDDKTARKWQPNDSGAGKMSIFRFSRSAPGLATRAVRENDKKMRKKWQKKMQNQMTMKCKTKWQKSAKQKWQTNAKPNDKKMLEKRQKYIYSTTLRVCWWDFHKSNLSSPIYDAREPLNATRGNIPGKNAILDGHVGCWWYSDIRISFPIVFSLPKTRAAFFWLNTSMNRLDPSLRQAIHLQCMRPLRHVLQQSAGAQTLLVTV